ncbi:MAG: hypothetical protein ACKVOH_01645 [Chlamydiales bacterium]
MFAISTFVAPKHSAVQGVLGTVELIGVVTLIALGVLLLKGNNFTMNGKALAMSPAAIKGMIAGGVILGGIDLIALVKRCTQC